MTKRVSTSIEAPDSSGLTSAKVVSETSNGESDVYTAAAADDDEAELSAEADGREVAIDSQQLMLVVGSGRSGTSLFSGVMQRLGFYIPQPEIVADESNPTGFGEPQWVVDFHTTLLRTIGVQTTDARPTAWSLTGQVAYEVLERQLVRDWLNEQFAQAHRVLVKDPRLLWFVPLWCRAAEDLGVQPKFASVLRHPAEVVASKERWYSQVNNPPNRLAGWVNTMLYTERATRHCSRAYVVLGDLLSDWTRTIARLDEQLGLDVVSTVTLNRMQAVAQLVDPNLRRSTAGWDDLDVPKPLVELAEEVWTALVALAGNKDEPDAPVLARLDTARAEYGRLYGDAEAIASSSVWAAARRAKRRRAPKEAAGPVPTDSPGIKHRLRRSIGTAGRAVPMSVKKLVPESIKRPLRRRLR